MNTMRLNFLGAVDTVTGSCTLMEYNGKRYLIDVGMYQGEGGEKLSDNRQKILKKYISSVEAVFITHAHLDHIGMLPDFIEWGFSGIIWATEATIASTKIMLADAMKISGKQENEITAIIDKMRFRAADRSEGENIFNGFGKDYITVQKDFFFTILRSSHLLGSCSYLFCWSENVFADDTPKKEWNYLYFTGDLGPVRGNAAPHTFFKDHQIPFKNRGKQCFVMESTYGDRVRDKKEYSHENRIKKLAEIIYGSIRDLRPVLVPVFAQDRAQQVLADLYNIKTNYGIQQENGGGETLRAEDWDNWLNGKKMGAIVKLGNQFDLPKKNDSRKDPEQWAKEQDERNSKRKALIKKSFNDNEDKVFQNLPPERKEEIIKTLKPFTDHIHIKVESPLIEKMNDVYKKSLTETFLHPTEKVIKYKYLSEQFLKTFNLPKEWGPDRWDVNLKLETCLNTSRKTSWANVVVSASGMCDEGAVVKLLPKFLRNENAVIILTGYQAKDTNGYLLKNLREGKYDGENQKESMKLNGFDIYLSEVKCRIEDLSAYYSGHADQEQLVNYVTESNIEDGTYLVLLNHGTKDQREALKEAIDRKEKENISVVLPGFNKWFNLVTGEQETTETEEDEEQPDSETAKQFQFISAGGAHLYFPANYDEEKKQKIINYIESVSKFD